MISTTSTPKVFGKGEMYVRGNMGEQHHQSAPLFPDAICGAGLNKLGSHATGPINLPFHSNLYQGQQDTLDGAAHTPSFGSSRVSPGNMSTKFISLPLFQIPLVELNNSNLIDGTHPLQGIPDDPPAFVPGYCEKGPARHGLFHGLTNCRI